MELNFDVSTLIFQESKPLTDFQKKVIIQNEVFALIEQEDVRILNRQRFIQWLKSHKMRYNETSLRDWKKDKSKETKPIKKLDKKTYGFMTSHLKTEHDFSYLKSVIQDKLNRSESPTLYILSLNSWHVNI